MQNKIILFLLGCTLLACNNKKYDTIIRNGIIYDGNGGSPYKADIAIQNDTIAFIGDLSKVSALNDIDGKGNAIAPGFINMMGHSEESLFQDGRAQSDIRQGVTTEIFGESSFGPLNAKMKKQLQDGQGDIKYAVTWNSLGEYMQALEKKNIACNIASFVGTGTIRQNIMGEDDIQPNPSQLDSMKLLVRQAMEEGALGDDDLDRAAESLRKLEEQVVQLCDIFELDPADLNVELGEVGTLLPKAGGYYPGQKSSNPSILELLDRLLNVGVVLEGEVDLGLAQLDLIHKKMGFIAYGSGSKSKVFEAEVQENWKDQIANTYLFETLEASQEIDFETYLKLHKKEQKQSILAPHNEFSLDFIEKENPVLVGARYYSFK